MTPFGLVFSNTCLAVLIELTAQPGYSWPPRLGIVAPLLPLDGSHVRVSRHAHDVPRRQLPSAAISALRCLSFHQQARAFLHAPWVLLQQARVVIYIFKDTSDDSIFPILINFFILPFLKIPIFWLCVLLQIINLLLFTIIFLWFIIILFSQITVHYHFPHRTLI